LSNVSAANRSNDQGVDGEDFRCHRPRILIRPRMDPRMTADTIVEHVAAYVAAVAAGE
jgi:hypothetical protein